MASLHQKRFQSACLENVGKGLINQADGSWKPATGNSMDLDMLAGYRLRSSFARQKREKKAAGGKRH